MARVFIALMLLAVPLLASAQASDSPVTLSFAWPPGLEARVDVARTRIVSTSFSAPDTSVVDVSYDLVVDPDADGLIVRHSGHTAYELRAGMSGPTFLLLLTSIGRGHVVSGDGEIVRVLPLGALEHTLRTWGAGALGDRWDEETEQLLGALVEPSARTEPVLRDWEAMVGVWRNKELLVGVGYEADGAATIAGVLVPHRYEFGIVGTVSCLEGGEDDDCIELTMTAVPEVAELGRAFDDVARRAAGVVGGIDPGELQVVDSEATNEMVVVTEPAGLVPHYLGLRYAMAFVLEVDGVRETLSDVEEVRYWFTYEAR